MYFLLNMCCGLEFWLQGKEGDCSPLPSGRERRFCHLCYDVCGGKCSRDSNLVPVPGAMSINASLNNTVKSCKLVASVGVHILVQKEKDQKREFLKQSPQQSGHVKIFCVADRLFALLISAGWVERSHQEMAEKNLKVPLSSAWRVTAVEGGEKGSKSREWRPCWNV